MENHIKIGIGVMILNKDKILLGHRLSKRKDTGGIQQGDCWALPGGKQEYRETIFDCAKREVFEETGLWVSDLQVFGAVDDIQTDRHFVTIWVIAKKFDGTPQVKEPEKEDDWQWFSLSALPENLYSPSEKFIGRYKKTYR